MCKPFWLDQRKLYQYPVLCGSGTEWHARCNEQWTVFWVVGFFFLIKALPPAGLSFSPCFPCLSLQVPGSAYQMFTVWVSLLPFEISCLLCTIFVACIVIALFYLMIFAMVSGIMTSSKQTWIHLPHVYSAKSPHSSYHPPENTINCSLLDQKAALFIMLQLSKIVLPLKYPPQQPSLQSPRALT